MSWSPGLLPPVSAENDHRFLHANGMGQTGRGGPDMQRVKAGKILRIAVCTLPLAGALAADLLPISLRAQQLLVLIVLIWFQTYLLFEVLLSAR